jgi:hypothetical protein
LLRLVIESHDGRPGADSEEKQEPAVDINIEPWTV